MLQWSVSNKPQLVDIPTKTKDIFFCFVAECNKDYRTGNSDNALNLYEEIINRHRRTKELVILIEDNTFLLLVYETLKAWNMDQRAANLVSFDTLKTSILSYRKELVELHNSEYQLAHLADSSKLKAEKLLKELFYNLSVMESQRRIVGVSKTLHFLLPDLVMPMDSKFTMTYFYGYNKNAAKPEDEFEDFKHIFDRTVKITKKLNLSNEHVKGGRWNTSVPKLIDNSIIGFDRYFAKSTVEGMITFVESFKSFTLQEMIQYRELLQKQKNRLDTAFREEIRMKILLEKAKQAGITVTDEEIEAELTKKKRKK